MSSSAIESARELGGNNHFRELTSRELQILQLVALGKSAKEVALECQIAPRTVESHLGSIRLKLRARNRTHMVAIAIATDILSICSLRVQPVAGPLLPGSPLPRNTRMLAV